VIATTLLSLVVTAVAVLLIGRLLPGFTIERLRAALITAVIVRLVTLPVELLTVQLLFTRFETFGEAVVPIASALTGIAGITGLWIAARTVPGVRSNAFGSVLIAGVLLKVFTAVGDFMVGIAINTLAGSR
jgi:uncharacterized membrane protein YvlD (DUF360 family)